MSCGIQKKLCKRHLAFRRIRTRDNDKSNEKTHIFVLVDDINPAGLVLVHGTAMERSPNGDII